MLVRENGALVPYPSKTGKVDATDFVIPAKAGTQTQAN
jgi:hypothetical protein